MTHANPASEDSVLSALLCDENALWLADALTTDDFTEAEHRRVFGAVQRLVEDRQPVDLASVASELRSLGIKEHGIVDIAERYFTSANLEHHAKELKRHTRARDFARALIDAAEEIKRPGTNADEMLSSLVMEISDIGTRGRGSEYASLKTLTRETLKRMQSNEQHASIVTGLRSLDDNVSLGPGDLAILAARPSMGKTSLALGVAMHVAIEQGKRAAVFSLEMPRQQISERTLATRSGVGVQRIRNPKLLGSADYGRITPAVDAISRANLEVCDRASDLQDIRSIARRMHLQGAIDLLVVDYLQLIRAKAHSREREVAEVSWGLKTLAMELRIPILCLSQLNRSAEKREGHRPSMADLRESGAIEQDADLVMLLYRESYYNHDADPELAEVSVAKNRHGPTGTVEIGWQADAARFFERARA